MESQDFQIIKSSGETTGFKVHKLRKSLKASGANDTLVKKIVNQVIDELYPGISTREIYNRAFAMLKRGKSVYASKYKLKKAIYELGPTGFPFEQFVSGVLHYSGYETQINQTLKGTCVSHEIDVVAVKNGQWNIIECKFHGEQGLKCNVKVPMYVHSRYSDVKEPLIKTNKKELQSIEGWVVTNTRFTADALNYGKCMGLYLLSWDHPKDNALKDRIDRLGLYPLTVSTLLSNREKQFLLNQNVVLCRQILGKIYLLDHLGISNSRKERIIEEMKQLCIV
ncbi:ATP cone domain-containing protein [Flagellimonas allohymeniacidonis]|uniref:ATPase n=1 Tax=Flagellimonas allohymeniacidonis TaxID=2517819 RepID=A0A4V2HSN4_9FLAO|nr:ATP cone domain-containing protein [Allomuricauda hymeniacidonis]TAI48430.1 ATPase [Allomuricauda hymeniacidonis]